MLSPRRPSCVWLGTKAREARGAGGIGWLLGGGGPLPLSGGCAGRFSGRRPTPAPRSRPWCGAALPTEQPPPEPLRPPRGAGEGLPGPEVGTGPGLAGRAAASRAREAADSPGPGLWTPSPAATTPSAGPRVSGEAGTPGNQWAVWFAPETVLCSRLSNPVTSELGLFASVSASAGDVPVRGSSTHKICLDFWRGDWWCVDEESTSPRGHWGVPPTLEMCPHPPESLQGARSYLWPGDTSALP